MDGFITVRGLVVLIAISTIPGWFLLAWSGQWRRWQGLQRWLVAVALSIAFYPVLFYWLRLLLPFLTLGPYKTGLLFALMAGSTVWRLRSERADILRLERLEWLAVAAFGMTAFTRFWIIRGFPYPAWSDSLHHVILTQLTAVQGRLPFTMEPYFPVPLTQYHLGLYSLSATAQWLAQVPAHTALLWTAQWLNGLCGIGVYLVLDRKVGRAGAIVGAVAAGLLSHQPAFYVNWGRFTQVSAQAIMLVCWLVTWEAIRLWRQTERRRALDLWSTSAFAVLLNGGVFLLHFRVAIFYLPLLLFTVLWEMWSGYREGRLWRVLNGVALVGLASLVAVMPAAWSAAYQFVLARLHPAPVAQNVIEKTVEAYHAMPWSAIPALTSPTWLLVLTGASAVIVVARRNRMGLLVVAWVGVLLAIGNAYLLRIPMLNWTNLSGVLIMFYLPIGLLLGSGTSAVLQFLPRAHYASAVRALLILILGLGFVASHVRVTEVEPYRYFVTEEDVLAMDWIRQNTAADATFAVNTYMWLPLHPHGTDAGYWIPYLAERETTAGVMIFKFNSEYSSGIVQMSEAVQRLVEDNGALAELRALGVDYVYVGARGNFGGPGLNVERLSTAADATLVYRTPNVAIFRIDG